MKYKIWKCGNVTNSSNILLKITK